MVVLLNNELNITHQCALAAKVANSIPGCIRQNIASRSRELILPPLLSSGETNLEYCARNPSVREVGILEGVL